MLHAHGRNISQHCCANNVGSCCVRVGSGVQTDTTTPNIVWTYSASWEGYNPCLCKPCVIMSVRGPNIVGRAVQPDPFCCATLRRSRNKRNVGSCWLKSLTGFKLSATTCNRVCKRTQHVTSNNVGSCWSTIFASVCTQPNASFYHLLKCNFIQNLDF